MTRQKWEPTAVGAGSVTSVDISGVDGITATGGPVTVHRDNHSRPGLYGYFIWHLRNPTLGVNAQGRITSIENGWGDPTVTAGDMIYNNGSAAVRLPPGGNGQVLQIVNGIPTWAPAGGANGGTVTSIDVTASGGG